MTFSPLDSALTGPLFATDAMRAVFSDESRLSAMLRAEAALARAQSQADLVPEALAGAIDGVAAASLDAEALGRLTSIAGVPTIPFVEAVQARLPKDVEAAFHKGTTTQDILDTALVLQMRDAFDLVAVDVAAIVSALAVLARRHRATPCVGRTYGQQAAPLTFGYKASIWCLGVAETGGDLPRLRSRVLTASLGGPVGTLASLRDKGPAVAEAFAAELGLVAPAASWHVRRARMVEAGTWLATLLGTLAKMALDISDLVSTEVAEAAEPYQPGRGGSSAMPHKRNPVSSTVILAAHSAAKGHVVTLLDAMAAAHERPAGAWHAEWHALPQLFGLASGALREARVLAEGLEVDARRMRLNLDATAGLLFADSVALRLSRWLGRAAAHQLVERAANAARQEGTSLHDAVLEQIALRHRDDAGTSGLPAPDDITIELAAAFDLQPAIDAAGIWADRAITQALRLVDAQRSDVG